MARAEARVFSSIWDDGDWRTLPARAQWLYLLLLSQKDLSMCGVLTVTPGRWASLAADMKPEAIEDALRVLSDRRFVVHDPETVEVWLRAFLRRDGVLRTPNLVVAVARSFDAVHSQLIRQGIVDEFRREFGDPPDDGLRQRFPKGFPDGFAQRFPQGFRDALHGPCTEVTPSLHHSVTVVEGSVDPSPVDDDDRFNDVAAQAALLLAKRDLERRVADRGPVGDRSSWLATAQGRREAEVVSWLEERHCPVFDDPHELADRIDPPTPEHVEPRCDECSGRYSAGTGWLHFASCSKRKQAAS